MAGDPTVSTGEIARLGGVGRAAVSNWRRRHDDFPEPVAGTASSPRFALTEVEAWLRRNGRATGSRPRISRGSACDRRRRPAPGRAGRRSRGVPARPPRTGPCACCPARTPAGDPELRRVLDELRRRRGPAAAFDELCARYRGPGSSSRTRWPRPWRASRCPATAPCSIPPAVRAGCCSRPPPRCTRAAGRPRQARIAAARLLLTGRDGTGRRGRRPARTRSPDGSRGRLRPPDRPHTAARRARGRPPLRLRAATTHRTRAGLAAARPRGRRPGGTVVVRMPATAADRRAGRRIRANLLRAGALRAVLTVPTAPRDVWVLRRPQPGGPAGARLLVRGARVRQRTHWTAFRAGRPLPEARGPCPSWSCSTTSWTSDRSGGCSARLRRGRPPPTRAARADPEGAPRSWSRSGATGHRHRRRAVPPGRAHGPAAPGMAPGAPATWPLLTVTDLATGTVATGRAAAHAGQDPGAGRRRGRGSDGPGARRRPARGARARPHRLPRGSRPARRRVPRRRAALRTCAGGTSTRHGQRARVPLLPLGRAAALRAWRSASCRPPPTPPGRRRSAPRNSNGSAATGSWKAG